MSKRLFFVSTTLLVCISLFFFSCATNGTEEIKTKPPVERSFEVIDWQGASMGGQIPAWAAVATTDEEALKRLDSVDSEPTYKGKAVEVAFASGQDIDLLKAWVQNEIAASVATQITQVLTTESGQKQIGNKDDRESARKMIQKVIGVFSSTSLSGLQKSRDFWTKKYYKKTGRVEFDYVAIYVISQENLNLQIDRALGKISAKTKAEKEALDDIKRVIKKSTEKAQSINLGETK